MSRRIVKKEKIPLSLIKIKEIKKKVFDSINEDRIVQEDLVKSNKDLECRIKSLKETIDTNEKEVEKSTNILSKKREEIKDLEKDISQKELQLEDIRIKSEEIRKETEENVKNEIEQGNIKLNDIKSNIESANTELDDINVKVKESLVERQNTEKVVRELNEIIRQREEWLVKLDNELKTKKIELSKTAEQIAKMYRENNLKRK
jgi:chromosome segregation ATPase